jgi:hypothetical protein
VRGEKDESISIVWIGFSRSAKEWMMMVLLRSSARTNPESVAGISYYAWLMRQRKLTDGNRMVRPFYRSPDWISLTIQEDTYRRRSCKTRDQELVLSGYDHDIGIWCPVEFGWLDLRYGQYLCQRHITEVNETVGIR